MLQLPPLFSGKSKLAAVLLCMAVVAVPVLGLPAHYALAIGLLLGISVGNPLSPITKPITKKLLQASVVGLGFGMDIQTIARAGAEGFWFTVATIAGALVLGLLLGIWLGVGRRISYLISAGTAICGGSAIAAVSPVVDADEKEISVAMATVFTLNAVALLVFPYVGQAMHLSQQQFGLWSAIAIHDTSSVVGAASAFGSEAVTVATTVKLARALWIIPLVLVSAMVYGKKAGLQAFPVFILLFVLAAMANSWLHLPAGLTAGVVSLSKTGLSITLLLIGAGISLKNLKEVGLKALLQGVLLWLALLLCTLAAVLR